MDLELKGRRALVTGSSAGIGRAIASRFAEEGASVVITGRDQRKAEAVAREIHSNGSQVIASVGADLSTDEGGAALTDKVVSELGGVDILVNNHGSYVGRGWWDTTPTDWSDMYNQNVVSFVRLIQGLAPRMRDAGWGRIINISSGGAWQPFAAMADYTASKAAVLNLTVSLSREFAETGVTVNAVSPGIVVTGSTERFFRGVAQTNGWPDEWPEIEKLVIRHFLPNSSGRLGRPGDIANIVALIASPLSGYMNGANYRIDGGSTVSIN